MSVVNGQKVEASVVNNAFMSRLDNTSTVGKVALQNTDAGSGSAIINTQGYINKLANILGTSELDATPLNYISNDVVADGDNHKVAIEKLDAYAGDLRTDVTTLQTAVANIQAEQIVQNNRLTTIESSDSTFGGNKTFSGSVTIQGNLDVNGTLTTINSTQLEVTDPLITLNDGGTDVTANGAGIEIERPSGNAAIVFDPALASKFKIGLLTSLYEVVVSGVAQVVSGIKDFITGIKTDTINESTLNAGVTVDAVLIKDGLVDGRDVSADGTTLDGHTTTLGTHTTQIGQLQTDVSNIQAEQVTQNNRLTNIESNNSTFGGNKTFTGNVDVQGNLNVVGLLQKQSDYSVKVSNNMVTLNSSNTALAAEGGGIEIARAASPSARIEFDSSLPSKFKIGLTSQLNEVLVSGPAQTVSGLKTFTSGIATASVAETVSGSGVTVANTLINNGSVAGVNIAGLQTTVGNLQTWQTTAQNDISNLQTNVNGLQTWKTSVDSGNHTFSGNKTFSNDVTVQGKLTVNDIVINSSLVLGATVNTQNGFNVTLNVNSPYVSLESDFMPLESVVAITAPPDTRMVTIVNNGIMPVTFKHNASPTDSRIRVSNEKDLKLKPRQHAVFIYNTHMMGKGWMVSAGSSPTVKTFEMKIRGNYGGMAPKNAVDGFWINNDPINIFKVYLYQITPGTGGTTTIDIKRTPFGPSSTTYSLFSTLPSVTPAAGSNAWCGMGDSVTGFTMPATFAGGIAELTGIGPKTAFRLDLISAQTGSPADVGVIVYYYDAQ